MDLNILVIAKYFVEKSVITKAYINILKNFYSKNISYYILTDIYIYHRKTSF